MERTTYFNLNKPGLNDQVAVSDLNQNMDILDSNVHRVDLTNGGTVRGGATKYTRRKQSSCILL